MKKITIPSQEHKFESYLIATSGITGISQREIDILVAFNAWNEIPIKSPDLKKVVAKELHISYKTLNIFIRNMKNKGLLIEKSRGEYDLSTLLQYSDKTLIEII